MANPSSRRIHLSENTKRVLVTLSDKRKMDLERALERMASVPMPDGYSKVEINGSPYVPGVIVFSGKGFQLLYKVESDDSIKVAAIWQY